MAKKKPKKKVKVRELRTFVNVRLDEEVCAKLFKKAKRHAGGNLSAWLRYAGCNYEPKAGERIRHRKVG